MGLFNWLRRWLWGATGEASPGGKTAAGRHASLRKKRHPRVRLAPLRRAAADQSGQTRTGLQPEEIVASAPYRFARPCVTGGWLDLSRDGDPERLQQFGLPVFQTPQQLADWLELSPGRLAWLVHRFEADQQPVDQRHAHYHFRWLKKRSGGRRLIESPKPLLKQAQRQILQQILNKIPAHHSAHGFVQGRSIKSHAAAHAGRRVIVTFDLENFYATVGYARVVAIFRGLGYCREAALWLARLTTSDLPPSAIGWSVYAPDLEPYFRRHLPQGAPTSPALANLSAFSLDLRLSGLARTFHASYTRYADDLTFSGDEQFLRSLRIFIPLVEKIAKNERFLTNRAKRKVVRDHQRQQVTGVVVNERPNVSRRDYDRLRAILTNCQRRGPSTQNHERRPDFAAHLRGAIAHVAFLNPTRGARLLELFHQIDWNR
ncbi:MAG: reverse transcriptase family protein [Planctomycetales bacterium]